MLPPAHCYGVLYLPLVRDTDLYEEQVVIQHLAPINLN